MRLIAALLVLAAAGCDTAPFADASPIGTGEMAFTADRDAYRRGDTAALTLRNLSADTLTTGVLECAFLEVWDGEAWTIRASDNGRACIEIAVVLAPGETLTGAVELDVPDGSYRFVHGLYGQSALPLATGAFRVD